MSLAPEGPVTDHEFHQRRQRVWKTLLTYGEVTRALLDELHEGQRLMEFELHMPGWDFPLQATMSFVELWAPRRRHWSLDTYLFEYRAAPRASGRKAHHWHPLADGERVFHAHCEDPEPRFRHYRDVPVRLLEAAAEFAEIHFARGLDCRGLFPLEP